MSMVQGLFTGFFFLINSYRKACRWIYVHPKEAWLTGKRVRVSHEESQVKLQATTFVQKIIINKNKNKNKEV